MTVATSDHGEHLGAHRLLGHEFILHREVLHVPLVVHGLEDVAPAVIDAVVGLADVAPSVLAWAGLGDATRLPAARRRGGAPRPGLRRVAHRGRAAPVQARIPPARAAGCRLASALGRAATRPNQAPSSFFAGSRGWPTPAKKSRFT